MPRVDQEGDVSPGDRLVPTWHARSGRLTERKRRALDELAERFAPRPGWPELTAGADAGTGAITVAAAAADRAAVTGVMAATGIVGVAVEIGAGSGEAALALATARPGWLVVAAEVHRASLARLLLDAEAAALTNLRVVGGDGRAVLDSIAERRRIQLVRAFFPDPWPKHRHRARRLLEAGFAERLARALAPGGTFELATDDARYFARAQRVLDEHGGFALVTGRRPQRPVTYYERRAHDAGRAVHELAATRRHTDPAAPSPAAPSPSPSASLSPAPEARP